MKYTYDLQKLMGNGSYLLAIRDNFERLLSKSVFSIIESQMNNDKVDINIKNRIFSVVVECVQNICSNDFTHATEKNSILLLNKIDDGHKIIVGTLLTPERKTRIDEILTLISNSSLEELKAQKKMVLSTEGNLNEMQKEKLALLDMFIRSAGKVKYHYDNEGGNDCFLVIEIEISNK